MARQFEPTQTSAPVSGSFTVPGSMDWALLTRQKRWLLEHAQASEEAAGLLELLDAIQDAAVDIAGVPEAIVFPVKDNSEEEDGDFHRDDGL
jgi:hypothetical protein